MKYVIRMIFDLVIAGCIVLGTWIADYKIPQPGVHAEDDSHDFS